MKMSLTNAQLKQYILHQIIHFFPDDKSYSGDQLFELALQRALERTEYCFQHVALPAFHQDGITKFSHLHSDQYTLFLWFLSNEVWKGYEDTELASKLFYLNKILNGVLCMYDAGMPNIFLIVHGGGVVLGKAQYDDFFVCYQGCTVGAIEGVYPVLGKGVAMAPHSSIIGQCHVGHRVTIGNQALLRNTNVPSDSLYLSDITTGAHRQQSSKSPWAQQFFNVPIRSDLKKI
ncbi:hypothetical protein [Paenibacillus endoradicis]|uniref:hypothetical protein n=1 Tax=Paenibacillus endoradicis TaxID=2972487 RepID=UPI00215995F2|nr:hypothetical protein [Paenibacillus endoradicis]MCR8659879.1 hypothetical protein [Paenibacillus endoradicis]